MKPIDTLTDNEWSAIVQQAVAMPDVPPRLVQEALALWRLRQPPAEGRTTVQRWLAVLSFDSWAGAAVAAGMRALHSPVRQLLFTTEGGDVDLRIEPVRADHYLIHGQVISASVRGRVQLSAMDRQELAQREVELDEFCEFNFDDVGPGVFQIIVHLDQGELALPPVEVGPFEGRGHP